MNKLPLFSRIVFAILFCTITPLLTMEAPQEDPQRPAAAPSASTAPDIGAAFADFEAHEEEREWSSHRQKRDHPSQSEVSSSDEESSEAEETHASGRPRKLPRYGQRHSTIDSKTAHYMKQYFKSKARREQAKIEEERRAEEERAEHQRQEQERIRNEPASARGLLNSTHARLT